MLKTSEQGAAGHSRADGSAEGSSGPSSLPPQSTERGARPGHGVRVKGTWSQSKFSQSEFSQPEFSQSEFSQPENENESEPSLPSASGELSEEGRLWDLDMFGMLTDLPPVPFPAVPTSATSHQGKVPPESEGSSGQASGNPECAGPGLGGSGEQCWGRVRG